MKFLAVMAVLSFVAVVIAVGSGSTSSSVPAAGTTTTLWSECPAMPSEASWKSFSSSMTLNDRVGAATLLVDRGGAFLPAKTTVMLKRWIFPSDAEVSVQNGAHAGRQMFMRWSCAMQVSK